MELVRGGLHRTVIGKSHADKLPSRGWRGYAFVPADSGGVSSYGQIGWNSFTFAGPDASAPPASGPFAIESEAGCPSEGSG